MICNERRKRDMRKTLIPSIVACAAGLLLAGCGNGQAAVNSKNGAKANQPALATSQNDKQVSSAVSQAQASLRNAKLKETSGGASETLVTGSSKDAKATSESIKKAAEKLAKGDTKSTSADDTSNSSSASHSTKSSSASSSSSDSSASGSAPVTVSKDQVDSSRTQIQAAGVTRHFSDEDIAKMIFYIADRQASITDAANNADYIIKTTPTVKVTK